MMEFRLTIKEIINFPAEAITWNHLLLSEFLPRYPITSG
jgi:hypothetical protein